MSSATIVTIKGKSYEFINKDGKTELYFSARTTPRADRDKAIREVPPYWFVTRKSGELLFALRPKAPSFKILTAEELNKTYKGQWFEPLADNYYELVWTHPASKNIGSPQYENYKHITWQEIYNFSTNPTFASYDFLQYLRADWKRSSSGADHYIMALVDDLPYWADALGQIPFSIWYYKNQCTDLLSSEETIKKTVLMGMRAGSGKFIDIVLNNNPDMSNRYDNYFVLRGAIWASKRFIPNIQMSTTYGGSTRTTITETSYEYSILGKSITLSERDKNALWNYN